MTSKWAARGEVSSDVLQKVQSGLTVAMMMTPRTQLMTCLRSDSVAEVMAKNTARFSYLPVISPNGEITGLFHAHRFFDVTAPNKPIADETEQFSEGLVIGADASIYEFVTDADQRPTRLVVSGGHVSGLVSISDLQQLPVRASLFTLITALEMAMSQRIECEWPADSEPWKVLLSKDRREKLESKIREAKTADGYISDVALSQFCDKATVVRKKKFVSGTVAEVKKKFRLAEDLRNSLAHSNYYAETPETAQKVCEAVRVILAIKNELIIGGDHSIPAEAAST